ncbi:carbamoyltransferase [Clostridium cavendishii DSM 21758]|uniref:Carbamoyltransferase n=1 Tax=Clostridium cavendishii DSM 21758 TaxID=1121302 RepID=A0A1M6MSK4_9CLOT|nr:carbamoyltransferase C-terminal domain-containing protein [Clostridium cavendishii]SHJ86392.1 carbamoyltransferase [Clostridium cavendishii DSM 21758]
MYVLGIAGLLGHDAAACLMQDGEIIAMVEEERLSRVPHSLDKYHPRLAIEECLKIANIQLDDVDYIALSWDNSLLPDRVNIPDASVIFSKREFQYKTLPKIETVNHHLAHAASSFYFSGFDEASVLVVDGAGEDSATTMYYGKGSNLKKIKSIDYIESLGEFYSLATAYLGFSIHDAGKMMGLAPYGKPIYSFPRIKLDNEFGYRIDVSHNIRMDKIRNVYAKDFIKMGIDPRYMSREYDQLFFRHSNVTEFSQQHLDFSASVQKTLEDCYINLVKVLVNNTRCRNLCLSGGVALNCTANGRLSRMGLVDDMFIQPAAHDAGTAIGAAAYVMAQLGYKISPIKNTYKGNSFKNDKIIKLLDHLGMNYVHSSDISGQISEYLGRGYVIGWFQGAAEYGPRALGNRSIIADPTRPGIRDYVNNKVKLREPFRPFGPSVLESEVGEWFENINQSRYMLKAVQVKEEKRKKIEGAVHVDGSSRPQTVTAESNPRYYDLIESFYKKSGVPMVLNTSFNLRGEAMVYTPYDAIRTFYTSALDVLVMEDIIVKKRVLK